MSDSNSESDYAVINIRSENYALSFYYLCNEKEGADDATLEMKLKK